MRSERPAPLSVTIARADHSSLRAVVAALVLLLAVSTVPAAASPEDDPAIGDLSDTAGFVASEAAGPDGGSLWPLQLEVLLDEAMTAVAEAAGEERVAVAQADSSKPQGGQSAKRFKMNLYRKGDFASQKTTFWCIPASTQMMMNMMDGGRPNRSRSMQARLYRIGDRLEEDGTFSGPEPDGKRGMGISEWVGLLNRYDYGPYELAGAKSFQKALKKAARMMRETGKPVGLVVWRGAHAWVMSGFVATADPALTNDFTVTKVWVQDPWYPRTSSIWGRSRGPNAKVSPKVLRQDFKRYGRPGRTNPERDGRFMLVLPRPDRAADAAA